MMSCAASAVKIQQVPTAGTSEANRADRDEIVINHLPLVKAIAARVRENLPVQVELDDLVHAGVLGLFDAVQKYDPSKKVVFPLYAKHRIRGAILDSLRQLDWASRDLRKRFKHVEAMTQKLGHRLGRAPTEAELAREMGVGLGRWRKLIWELHTAGLGAYHSHLGGPGRDSLERFASAETPLREEDRPDRSCARQQLRQLLGLALRTLPQRYQRVVTLYYSHGCTMKQIGRELGVNESRVSQIHKAALEKLHTALGGRGIHTMAIFLNS